MAEILDQIWQSFGICGIKIQGPYRDWETAKYNIRFMCFSEKERQLVLSVYRSVYSAFSKCIHLLPD